MTDAKGFKVKFVKERETKNCIRYQEVEQDGWVRVGTMYIQKAAVAQGGLGDSIIVEIRPAGN